MKKQCTYNNAGLMKRDSEDTIMFQSKEYKTITSIKTGKVWLDRNIGADRAAESFDDIKAYGNHFTMEEITQISEEFPNFRLPTIVELEAENIQDREDAYSKLKLPSAGYFFDNAIYNQGYIGYVWSSAVSDQYFEYLYFYYGNAYTHNYHRAEGLSVRLIQDSKKEKPNKPISDGGSNSFYVFPTIVKDVDSLCRYWKLSSAEGNILKSLTANLGARHTGTNVQRETKKCIHYSVERMRWNNFTDEEILNQVKKQLNYEQTHQLAKP